MAADKRDKTHDAQVQAFVTELMGIAKDFAWHVDKYGQIRGQALELPPRMRTMCPMMAVAFKASGKLYLSSHEACEVLAMSEVSFELTAVVDNFCNHPWRKWILEALELLK